MSINAVKGVEIGDGFAAITQRGSQHRDEMSMDGFTSNHAGGILGGISSGQPVTASIVLKPTSSILIPGHSVNLAGEPTEVVTKGRHDPCVGIRATPIAEAMMALVLMDHALHAIACPVRRCGPGTAALHPVTDRTRERKRSHVPMTDKPRVWGFAPHLSRHHRPSRRTLRGDHRRTGRSVKFSAGSNWRRNWLDSDMPRSSVSRTASARQKSPGCDAGCASSPTSASATTTST